jgi:citronellyl-CoA dehydrogenase
MRSTTTAQVYFDNVRVPQRNLVGAEGMGFMMQMMQFQEERMWACANAVGGLENVIQQTIDYTKERTTFGQPLINNQYVHFRFAELMTEVEALKALTYQACEQHIAGENVTMLASMANSKQGVSLVKSQIAAYNIGAEMALCGITLHHKLYRDGRLGSIGGGADEIMLGIICKLMDILPKKQIFLPRNWL